MTLQLWQLLIMLAGLLLGARLLAWWAWRLLSSSAPGLWNQAQQIGLFQRAQDKLAAVWPRTSHWLGRRFSTASFTGLPLTLMLAFAVYLLFLAGGLLEELFDDEELTHADQSINQALSILRDPDFLQLFGWITSLANTETLIAITLVAVGFLWAHERSVYIPGLLLTILGSQAITWAGKFAIARERPEFITFATASSSSFPSAHATGAIAVYGFIAYAIARDLVGVRRRFELAYWASALILMIAFSRMLLSVHYASDIAAGLLVGGLWLVAGFALTEYLRERREV